MRRCFVPSPVPGKVHMPRSARRRNIRRPKVVCQTKSFRARARLSAAQLGKVARRNDQLPVSDRLVAGRLSGAGSPRGGAGRYEVSAAATRGGGKWRAKPALVGELLETSAVVRSSPGWFTHRRCAKPEEAARRHGRWRTRRLAAADQPRNSETADKSERLVTTIKPGRRA